MLHYTRLERMSRDKHSRLLAKVTKPFIFVAYEWAQKLERYVALGWKGLTKINILAYWSQAYVTKKKSFANS
jgi:hypothetical protein